MGPKKKPQLKNKEDVQLPADFPHEWKTKCKNIHWCAPFIDKHFNPLTLAQKTKVNCGHPPLPVTGYFKSYANWRCKKFFPKKKYKECYKTIIFLMQMQACFPKKAKERPGLEIKRAGNLAPDGTGDSVVIWLALGALLLVLLVGAIVAYWYLRGGGQKSGRHGGKGASKSASKTGKSMLGKSKLGSRKSSKRSSPKGSQQSKRTKSVKKK